MAVSRSGEVIYVLDSTLDRVVLSRIDAVSGAIRKAGFLGVPAFATKLALDVRGRSLYVMLPDEIRTLAIDADTDQLRDRGAVMSSSGSELILEPNGRFLYQLDTSPSELRAFLLTGPDGALHPIDADNGTPGPQGYELDPGTRLIRIRPDGRFLYASTNTTKTAFTVEVSGALTRLRSVPTGESSAPTGMAFAADGSSAYVLHSAGAIVSYAIDATTGALTRRDADGATIGVQNTAIDPGPALIELGPSGSHLIVAFSAAGPSQIVSFEIDAVSALPIMLQRFPAARTGGARRLAVAQRAEAALRSPRNLYVAGHDGSAGRIETFSIDAPTGDLTPVDSLPSATSASRLTSDRAHRFLYGIDSNVAGFEIDAASGVLTPMGLVTSSSAGHLVLSAVVNPSGWAVYAATHPATSAQSPGFNVYTRA